MVAGACKKKRRETSIIAAAAMPLRNRPRREPTPKLNPPSANDSASALIARRGCACARRRIAYASRGRAVCDNRPSVANGKGYARSADSRCHARRAPSPSRGGMGRGEISGAFSFPQPLPSREGRLETKPSRHRSIRTCLARSRQLGSSCRFQSWETLPQTAAHRSTDRSTIAARLHLQRRCSLARSTRH